MIRNLIEGELHFPIKYFEVFKSLVLPHILIVKSLYLRL
jgi:hypothetical protein